MKISMDKLTSGVLWHLTPQERVTLILEYQKQRYLTNKSFEKEIRKVQIEMPDEQRKSYAIEALTVIVSNRLLFDLFLSITSQFYQAYGEFFPNLFSSDITPGTTDKQFADSVKFYYQGLKSIYQSLLACKAVSKTLSQRFDVETVLYPQYGHYFQETEKEIRSILKSINNLIPGNKKPNYQPNPEIQELIIETIEKAVNDQFEEMS